MNVDKLISYKRYVNTDNVESLDNLDTPGDFDEEL